MNRIFVLNYDKLLNCTGCFISCYPYIEIIAFNIKSLDHNEIFFIPNKVT